jgi:flagellar biosynthesis protein FliR
MVTISSEMLMSWITSLIWPLTRILGVIAAAPIFSHDAIPVRVRVALGVLITLTVIPTLPPLPSIDLLSIQSVYILLQQLMIGIAIGFTMRIVFASIEMAGTVAGMTMGLGFASFYDPQSNGQTNAVTQYLVIIAMLLFLSLDMHLHMISAVVQSFNSLPITNEPSAMPFVQMILQWAGKIFSVGLHLALPMVAVLLLTNLALGILSRAAPQLNLFGIGFPITISIGFLILALALTRMSTPLQRVFNEGIGATQSVYMPVKAK